MKQSEIKEQSVEELTLKLATLRKEYEDMKITHAVSPLENPMLIRKTRRTVARIVTEINKREIQ